METNQNDKQKKIILAVVIVVTLAIMIFLGVQTIFLKREVTEVKKQLEEIKSVLMPEDEASSNMKDSTVSSGDAQQAVSSTIITQIPEEGAAEEPNVKHKVYLTFDDGPSKQTEAILDILDEYGVKATFFVVGKEGENVSERLQMIYERGHTIGMHSYSHDYEEIYDSVDAFRADFLKSKQYIYDAIGVETKYFRFPGGSSNTLSKIDMKEFVEFLETQGVEYYDWNISSGDGGGNLMPTKVIVDNCIKDISRYDTSIILLHDSASKTTTVEALPLMLEKILAMEDTAILPITESTKPVHHVIHPREKEEASEEKEIDEKEKEISK